MEHARRFRGQENGGVEVSIARAIRSADRVACGTVAELLTELVERARFPSMRGWVRKAFAVTQDTTLTRREVLKTAAVWWCCYGTNYSLEFTSSPNQRSEVSRPTVVGV